MTMSLETVAIDEIYPAEKNVRKHPKKQVDALKHSYELFGQYRPLVVDSDGQILVGNGMYKALVELGVQQAEVKRLPADFPDDMKKKLMLADNKTQSIGFDDLAAIEDIIGELPDFEIPGFDADILEDLYGDDSDSMDDYGILTPQRAEAVVREAQKRSEEPPLTPEEVAEKVMPKNVDVHSPELTAAERHAGNYVTCPNCGMKIWL